MVKIFGFFFKNSKKIFSSNFAQNRSTGQNMAQNRKKPLPHPKKGRGRRLKNFESAQIDLEWFSNERSASELAKNGVCPLCSNFGSDFMAKIRICPLFVVFRTFFQKIRSNDSKTCINRWEIQFGGFLIPEPLLSDLNFRKNAKSQIFRKIVKKCVR